MTHTGDTISLAVRETSIKSTQSGTLNRKTEEPTLRWVCVNDVTWKLTDGIMLREPVSAFLGSVSSERALAWLTRDCETEAWPPDGVKGAVASPHHVWFVRINTGFLASIKHPYADGPDRYGPVTVSAAKKAAEHRLQHGRFPEAKPYHHVHWTPPPFAEATRGLRMSTLAAEFVRRHRHCDCHDGPIGERRLRTSWKPFPVHAVSPPEAQVAVPGLTMA
jgi:hypothetical protein